MKLIVDGYNLLFAENPGIAPRRYVGAGKIKESSYTNRLAMEEARERLVNLLERYKQSHHDAITIIFDGVRSEYPTRIPRGAKSLGFSRMAPPASQIEVLFSGINETADEVIIKLVRRQTNQQEIMVVTSDRAIQQQLKSTGVKIKSADDFSRELTQKKPAQPLPEETLPRQKIVGISPAEAERWLELFDTSDEK